MKRLLILLLLLPSLAWGSDLGQDYARMNPYILGGGVAACGPTSEPTGGILSDGFEGTGTGGYEFTSTDTACNAPPSGTTWCSGATLSASSLTALTGGTGETQNCIYGYLSNASASMVSKSIKSATLYDPEYVEFSFYVDSATLGAWAALSIVSHTSGPASSGTVYWVFRLKCGSGSGCSTSDNLSVVLDSVADSSAGNIDLDTWYYVRIYMADNSETCTITVGTTYGGFDILNAATWTSLDYTAGDATSYYTVGNAAANSTHNIYFGYFAVDGDGTF